MGSQLYTQGIWSVAQYNANSNSWLYNSTNGRINNNNKNNSNHGRALGYDVGYLGANAEFMQLYSEVWQAYRTCRKSKIHGEKQLRFEFDCAGAHNFKLKTRRYIEQFDKSNHYNMSLVEDFMAMFNSYMGYLKWCNARKLEKEQINLPKSSNLGKCYNIYPNKIKIKKNKTRIFRIIQANKTKEHNLLTKKSA